MIESGGAKCTDALPRKATKDLRFRVSTKAEVMLICRPLQNAVS